MIGSLVGPYRVLERLGAGGMGEVFLAEDTRLRRRVAIKRLTGEFVSGEDTRARILREARAVARLQHPGIAGVFDVVEDAGTVGIVMEYVEGDTLADRLRAGRLPLDRAVALGVRIADALAHAHAHGIVHCDLKPANIKLAAGETPKILDFGLAERTATAVAAEDTHTLSVAGSGSDAGRVVGSPGYMAPERLAGRPPDERSDVYSLGVVLYELLTGRRPFGPGDLVSVAVAALTTPVPSPSRVDPRIPAELSAVVTTALAHEPGARFASAGELAAALRAAAGESTGEAVAGARDATVRRRAWPWRRLAAGALLVALAAAAWALWRPGSEPAGGAAVSVVVKPFDNLSGDPANDFLGMGIAEDLTTRLATLPQVTVMSRSTTAAYLADNPASATLARDLGASFVVEGGVARSGDRLHVTVNVLRADGSVVWGDEFDGTVAGLFSLHHDLADGLARQLTRALSRTERRRLADRPTDNVEAFADYAQGRFFLERRDAAGNIDHAIAAFERAIGKDPSFGLAQAGLGSAFWAKYTETNDAVWTTRAIDASLEALRLDPQRAEVRVALAGIYRGLGRTPAAVDELQQALALQPNSDDAHRTLGDILAAEGRTDEAVRAYRQAIAIRPNYWQNHNRLAVALIRVGRYADAAESCRRVTELQPDSAVGFVNLGVVAMMEGDLALALKSLTRAAEITPRASTFSNIGTIHYWEGRFDAARQAYQRALDLRPDDLSIRRNLGDALAQLGDAAGARAAYRRSADQAANQLKVNPKDAEALALLAFLHAKLGRPEEARASVDRAVELAPKNPGVHYRKAVIAAIAGDGDRAIAALETALQLGYSAALAGRDLDLRGLADRPEYRRLVQARHP